MRAAAFEVVAAFAVAGATSGADAGCAGYIDGKKNKMLVAKATEGSGHRRLQTLFSSIFSPSVKNRRKKGLQAAAVAVAALLRWRLHDGDGRLTRRRKKIGNILLSDAGWPRNAQVTDKKEKKSIVCTVAPAGYRH